MNEQSNTIAPAPKLGANDIGPHCLVTGGAGYVGSRLIKRLREAGCSVRSFDVAPHSPGEGVEVMTGDIRRYEDVRPALEGIDTVFHAAAVISLVALYRPSKYQFVYDVNVEGTKNVLRAAQEASVGAMVHISSINVVFDGNMGFCDETLAYTKNPKDLYAATKIDAEKAALAADHEGKLRTCAVRAGGVWGPDPRPIMMHQFLNTMAANRFKAIIGDGQSVADNTHVENLVDAMLLGAAALHTQPEKAGGKAYFITDDEPMNCMEWFRPLVEELGQPFPTRHLPSGLMWSVGFLLEVAHYLGAGEPTLTRRSVKNLSESARFSIERARKDLGYEPRHNRANSIAELLPVARRYIEEKRSGKARA